MNEEILKRDMFSKPLSKDARNSGIMSGFEDDIDTYGENPKEGPEGQEEQNLEDMPPMARTPQNPEILMNTLRGDMRSVDARYEELAQMVGEQAAQDTPPEVLAMLQIQLGQQGQQGGGIGGLPQGAGMMPPPMPGQGAPGPQGAAPGGMSPIPQGPMPAAGGPQGPFPEGGAEQAPPQHLAHGGEVGYYPPTADGMPPMHAALGALITPAMRYGQMAAERVGPILSSANATLGRAFAQPSMTQPFLENVRGPGGRFTAEQIQRGGEMVYPTLTQGMMNSAATLADKYPRISALGGSAAALLGLNSLRPDAEGQSGTSALAEQIPTDTAEERAARIERARQEPAVKMSFDQPFTTTKSDQFKLREGPRPMPPVAAPGEVAAQEPAPQGDTLGDFMQQKLDEANARPAFAEEAKTNQQFIKDALKNTGTKSRFQRIEDAANENIPLFSKFLGEDKETAKTNALLLLADAGFRFAGSRQPTVGMALSEALSGVPKGFAALAQQAEDRRIKINTVALQSAMSDVAQQDKDAQAIKMEILKGDMKMLLEQAKNGQTQVEDGGGGLRIAKNKQGGFMGVSIDPNDPTVRSSLASRYTLRDTDNPYVENRGQAPTSVETDKPERVKLTSTLRALDNSLSTLDNLKGTYAGLYSPGTWFQDKVNNLLVPVSMGTIRPDVNQVDAATRVSTGLNTILKNIASANDSGRVAVQEQEWARDTAKGISDPNAFFSNKEIAAKQFNSMEAMLRNSRQQVLTQLGYENNDYVMRTPNTGTQSDPFTVPKDPAEQKRMFVFLGSTIGKLQDPKATVYLQLPNGKIDAFNPTQLRGLIQ